ncbi:class I SAM-dependent methyltransferase [Aquimarina sediminis]|uniref:class I SAM-dependent methyltransferase n=1 Tax=Aquimarina sediminis TaxID=2070536 RepID=UPI000CA05BB2|nr:methyltransferase domain-containing protein [Aquimarina sediminis]
MKKLGEHSEYIGDELQLFKNAVNWKSYFSSKIRPYIEGDVLEVGAGIGINTRFLAKEKQKISSWSLLEPDANLASEIKSNIDSLKINKTSVINGTIDDLKDHRYDTIVYIDVLEHIEDAVMEIKKAKQCLKPNGKLIILVPTYNFLFSDFDKRIGHYRRYNKSLLLRQVNDELSLEKLFYLDSMGFFASLANKLFLKKELPSLGDIKFWDNYIVRLSVVFDVLFFKVFGKSLIGIFKNEK